MRSSDFEVKMAGHGQLSAVDVAGTFDFTTAVIYLKSLVASDIKRAQKALAEFKPSWNGGKPNLLTCEQFTALAKAQPLIVHEYTHFVDTTSTLWGFRHLRLMSEAYGSVGLDERDYRKAKAFSDHMRGIKLPDYYTVVHEAHDDRPWQSMITIGRVFKANGEISDHPILFSRFLNSDGEMIVRSPLSTVSILEASAMAQEVINTSRLLQLTDPEYRVVEDHELRRRTMNFLYSKHITEYSVCVHILANKLECSDALIAFSICARLVRLTLNFPEAVFNRLAENCPIEKVLGRPIEDDFVQAIRSGLRGRDLGTIYYLLCAALPANVLESKKHVGPAIAIALQALGTSEEELFAAARAEAEHLIQLLDATTIKYIKTLAQAGYENFKAIGLQSGEMDFRKLNLPPALLGDDVMAAIFAGSKNSLSKFDVNSCYSELDDGMSWVTRFSKACL